MSSDHLNNQDPHWLGAGPYTLVMLLVLMVNPGCRNRTVQEYRIEKEEIGKLEGKPNILLAMADDMSWVHTGYAGCAQVQTPAIDYLAGNGVWFDRAYCSAPSCSASRAALLTGRNGWELREGACLWSFLPEQYTTYTAYLEQQGYHTGFTGKGWGPGDWRNHGRKKNPAGREYSNIREIPYPELGDDLPISRINYAANFEEFLRKKPSDRPFCFWYGSFEPHREYLQGIGHKMGKSAEGIQVPSFLPDVPEVRSDILDYLVEIEWFDTHLGRMVDLLRQSGELDNTLIIVTSDNGMPFPRAKANLYEYGTRVPLVVYWKDLIPGGRALDDLVSHTDLAPTILEAAGLEIPPEMSGKSLFDVLNANVSGKADPGRNRVFTFRERHAWSQPDSGIYPMRAIRKDDYLLIWNQEPDMWPNGHPDPLHSWNYYPFSDVEWSPAKKFLLASSASSPLGYYAELCFHKRPEFELYDVATDPYQMKNLHGSMTHEAIADSLKKELSSYLEERGDLRMKGKEEVYERAPYIFKQGLGTGGMWLNNWQALSEEEKRQVLAREKDKIRQVVSELEAMGWEYTDDQ